MNAERFYKSLRALKARHPFRAFQVELTSGGKFQVEHPEALAVYGGQAVYVATDGEIVIFDHETVARLIRPGKLKGPNGKAGQG